VTAACSMGAEVDWGSGHSLARAPGAAIPACKPVAAHLQSGRGAAVHTWRDGLHRSSAERPQAPASHRLTRRAPRPCSPVLTWCGLRAASRRQPCPQRLMARTAPLPKPSSSTQPWPGSSSAAVTGSANLRQQSSRPLLYVAAARAQSPVQAWLQDGLAGGAPTEAAGQRGTHPLLGPARRDGPTWRRRRAACRQRRRTPARCGPAAPPGRGCCQRGRWPAVPCCTRWNPAGRLGLTPGQQGSRAAAACLSAARIWVG
jgi:hypothetical protein